MGSSCVAYNLEPEPEELFRQMIHEEVDKWVDELLVVFDKDSQPTIMELSELFTKTRKKFLGTCLQRLIEQKYSYLLEQEYCPCPKCGKSCKNRRYSSKPLYGAIHLDRPFCYSFSTHMQGIENYCPTLVFILQEVFSESLSGVHGELWVAKMRRWKMGKKQYEAGAKLQLQPKIGTVYDYTFKQNMVCVSLMPPMTLILSYVTESILASSGACTSATISKRPAVK